MSENNMMCLLFSGLVAVIASLTWFFSSRPRLFIRVFVPADERQEVAQQFLSDPVSFARNLRTMACLQFGLAALFFLGDLGNFILR